MNLPGAGDSIQNDRRYAARFRHFESSLSSFVDYAQNHVAWNKHMLWVPKTSIIRYHADLSIFRVPLGATQTIQSGLPRSDPFSI